MAAQRRAALFATVLLLHHAVSTLAGYGPGSVTAWFPDSDSLSVVIFFVLLGFDLSTRVVASERSLLWGNRILLMV